MYECKIDACYCQFVPIADEIVEFDPLLRVVSEGRVFFE